MSNEKQDDETKQLTMWNKQVSAPCTLSDQSKNNCRPCQSSNLLKKKKKKKGKERTWLGKSFEKFDMFERP